MEKIERNVKEFKLLSVDNIRLKCGTNNRKEPKVIYLSGKMWVKPLGEFDYSGAISNIRHKVNKRLKSMLYKTPCFDNRYILDFELNTGTMKKNTGKFMQFQMFVRQNDNNVVGVNSIKDRVAEYVVPLIYDMVEDFHDEGFELLEHKNSNNKAVEA